jgi:hypothetical protein
MNIPLQSITFAPEGMVTLEPSAVILPSLMIKVPETVPLVTVSMVALVKAKVPFVDFFTCPKEWVKTKVKTRVKTTFIFM